MKRIKVKVKEGRLESVNKMYVGGHSFNREYLTKEGVFEVIGAIQTKSSETLFRYDGDKPEVTVIESKFKEMYIINTELEGEVHFFAEDFDVVDWGDFSPEAESDKGTGS